MATATYDRTYLTDPSKVERLAIWILTSQHPEAESARRAMGTGRIVVPRPTQNSLRMAYRYLFDPASDPVGLIVAYCKTNV